jgi:hypothetical protein
MRPVQVPFSPIPTELLPLGDIVPSNTRGIREA